jgi:site-specific recombinase XerD
MAEALRRPGLDRRGDSLKKPLPGALVPKGAAVPPALIPSLASAASYARAEKSEATRKAYGADWRHFTTWSQAVQQIALPANPAAIAAYLAHLADHGRGSSTISRRLAAIGYAHKLKGLDNPANAETVRATLRGIRRRLGTAVTRKAPATARALTAMLAQIPDSLTGKRDRALLLLGFAAALRRSELVDLKVNDIEISAEGALIRVRRSKTDQEGAGHTIAIPRGELLRPVEAIEAWLSEVSDGPIFRPIAKGGRVLAQTLTDRSVASIVKRYAAAAGLDPKIFSGHSLRAGFVTSALEHGADLFKVMDVTRHRRVETLKGYDRRARAFRDHAGKDFL